MESWKNTQSNRPPSLQHHSSSDFESAHTDERQPVGHSSSLSGEFGRLLEKARQSQARDGNEPAKMKASKEDPPPSDRKQREEYPQRKGHNSTVHPQSTQKASQAASQTATQTNTSSTQASTTIAKPVRSLRITMQDSLGEVDV